MRTAVLVMAYGTPSSPEEIEAYYTDIRRGRPPTPEQLADLVGRYEAIGGISPLNARTAEQVAALQHFLDLRASGAFRTLYGSKHAEPKIEAAVHEAAGAGCERVVGLVLAPHFSALSVGEYVERAAQACTELGLPHAFLSSWHDEPALIEALAARVTAALASLPAGSADGATVCFSAHSLPARILDSGDPYPAELRATADLVAARIGLDRYRTAWQSAGRTGDTWLGPDIADVVEELARSGSSAVVVCPAGFTSDHLEVLYDLDVLASERARRCGIAFARTASLNAEPAVFEALAERMLALDASLGAPDRG